MAGATPAVAVPRAASRGGASRPRTRGPPRARGRPAGPPAQAPGRRPVGRSRPRRRAPVLTIHTNPPTTRSDLSKEAPQWPSPSSQAEEEGLPVLQGEGAGRRLQGHLAAAQVHLRPRQDPRPSGHRQLRPAPARRRDRGQERPRGGPAALHLHRPLTGIATVPERSPKNEAHPDPGGHRSRRPRRRGRGQGRLRPQLPGPARGGIRWTRGAEKTVESIKAARSNRAVHDLDHAEQIKDQARGGSGQREGPGRRVRPPLRCRDRRRHRLRRWPRSPARTSTSG